MFDWSCKIEAIGEEFRCTWEHQFVRLANGDVSNASNVGNLTLGFLVAGCL